MGNKVFKTVAAVLVLALVVTTMMDIEVPYLPIAVLALFLIAAAVHSKKTAVSEIVLNEENVKLILTDGSTVDLKQREIVRLKFTGSRVVLVLKNGGDYNVPKKRANAVIRKDGGPLRELRQDDFPFAEAKKALG